MKVTETIPAGLVGERVDRVVSMLASCSRAEAATLIEAGQVIVGGAVVTSRSAKVKLGDTFEVDVPDRSQGSILVPEPDIELTVVHEDEHLLVIDKPAGLIVHPGAGQPTGTLVHGLLARYPEILHVGVDPVRPGVVHRLDKGTSGLLLVARTQMAYTALVAALSARAVHRRYRTLVWGRVAAASGLIDAPIGRSTREAMKMAVAVRGKEARTRYEVLATFSEPVEVTELACTLETGRTHQIRVHLTSIGHPVVGDLRYHGARQSLPMDRPFLHAELLELAHPITGDALRFESAIPEDLVAVLSQLR
ncbi:MAG: RluA family pseudouridine synthase [Acidimicrobiales bacterium]